MNNEISLQQTIGKGYAKFWKFKGNEVIMMGSKGSKKSKTIALRWAKLLKEYPQACLICMRDNANTLRDSCFADMKWAMKKLHLQDEWNFITSPLQATNKFTNQKILFRGLDDFQKLASVDMDDPDLYLCFGWFEEAFEIDKEDTYTTIRMSLRGELPEGYFNQTVASFNPWHTKHWIVKRLIRNLIPVEEELEKNGKQEIIIESIEKVLYNDEEIEVPLTQLLMINNYKLNEFLSPMDLAKYSKLEKENPKKYKTIGLGMPGVPDGLVYEDVFDEENVISYKDASERKYLILTGGVDYGQVESATTGMFMGIDGYYDDVVIIDEYYHSNYERSKKKEINEYASDLVNFFEAKRIEFKWNKRLDIFVDNAAPGFIGLLNQEAKKQKCFLLNFMSCWKRKIKERQDITKGLMAQKRWLCTNKCVNYMSEVENCEYQEGKEERVKDPCHAIDGSEYGTTPYFDKLLRRGEQIENNK